MSSTDLLAFVLARPGVAVSGDGVQAFWAETRAVRERFPAPIDAAIAGGHSGDRLACAFVSGYQAALRAMVPSPSDGRMLSFCVTEDAGNHPRAIQTSIDARGAGKIVIRGSKRWSTLAPLAETLIVVAKSGDSGDGRPKLHAVVVPRASAGLSVTTMPPTPFVPEVPHAELSLADVELDESAVLPGDGYDDFVKPFRTIEDLHVQAAVVGYWLSVAERFGFGEAVKERLAALVLAARALASLSPRAAETHVALAGLLTEIGDAGALLEPEWARVDDAERERWYRDRGLVQVASKARQRRRERAWERLEGKER